MHLLLNSLCFFAALCLYDKTITDFLIKKKAGENFRLKRLYASIDKILLRFEHMSGICFVNKTIVTKMIPIKEILNRRHLTPRPPVLVVDESHIKCWNDAGPICGCDEKYDLIKRYKPFIPGAVNPYNRRKISDTGCLEVYWKRLKMGEDQLIFEKPIAIHPGELSENFKIPEEKRDSMLIRQHRYTDDYIMQKLRQCQREHTENCSCPNK